MGHQTPSHQWEAVPKELRDLPQWIRWVFTGDDPPRKLPLRVNGRAPASSTHPKTWGEWENVARPLNGTTGIGFVFAEGDPYTGVDFDECLNADGTVTEWAEPWIKKFPGAYMEVSPSGRGVKLWTRGKLPGPGGSRKIGDGRAGIEVYDRARFFCCTGQLFGEPPAEPLPNHQAAIDELYAWIKRRRENPAQPPPASTLPSRFVVSASERASAEERAARYLDKIDPAISGERGHDQTFKAAMIGPGFDLAPETCFRMLRDVYNHRCVPPWSERELRHKVESAYAREPRRGWLLNAERIGESVAPSYGEWALVMAADRPETVIDPARAPERFRGVLKEMGAAKPNMRRRVMGEWIATQPDAEALGERIDAIDPNQPAPVDRPEITKDKTPRVVMRRFSDIQTLPVEWLWRDRIPLGMLSMLAGDPKLGKSFVTVAMAAAVSQGVPLPHGDAPPGPASVVLMGAEDDPERTIRPRLESAGANLDKVHSLDAVRLKDGGEALPSLAADIDRIAEAVEQLGDCRLVVIDPITAYLGGVDDHRNAELRGVLSPLKAMAARLNVAVVLVTHLNKGAGTNGKHRVTGSIAYVGACRANFMFIGDRDAPGRTLMLPNGCNLAPASLPGLAYRIWDRGEGPTVEWEAAPVALTVEEALEAEQEDRSGRDNEAARECEDWLRETLSRCSMTAQEIDKTGRAAGFAVKQLRSAKEKIRAKSKRQGFGPGSKLFWTLPHNTDSESEGDTGASEAA